jgi:hypothetical protein
MRLLVDVGRLQVEFALLFFGGVAAEAVGFKNGLIVSGGCRRDEQAIDSNKRGGFHGQVGFGG